MVYEVRVRVRACLSVGVTSHFVQPAGYRDALPCLQNRKVRNSCGLEDFAETHLCKLCVIL